mmetsp:Transcript_32480/g.67007  ORF Transcript_32480/g.67007 Transcript_32480/m.67007 type:complete len:228 (-) Transcript_32480:540-1223(-)
MDLHDTRTGVLVRVRELDLSVQASGAEQRGIQRIWAVRGCDDLHGGLVGEAVQLVQQLEHRSLYLADPRELPSAGALLADGVQLVDEDDSRRFLFCKDEGVTDDLRTIADEHLHQLGSCQLEESGIRGSCASSGHHGLASSRRPMHQHSLRGLDADVFEALLVGHGQDDCLLQLLNLLLQTANVAVLVCGALINLHRFHAGVVLWRQLVQDQVGVLVHTHQVIRFQF